MDENNLMKLIPPRKLVQTGRVEKSKDFKVPVAIDEEVESIHRVRRILSNFQTQMLGLERDDAGSNCQSWLGK